MKLLLMKLLIVMSILLSMTNTSAKAVSDDPSACRENSKESLKIYPKNNLSFERKLASLASENIGLLSEKLCIYFIKEGAKIATLAKKAIIKHMKKYEGIESPTPGQIIKFLNHNKNYMTCGSENKNYMMVSFEHGRAYDQLFNVLFFGQLLTDDESQYVDINAISYHRNGEPETVLDFMYREYNDPRNPKGKRREVKRLIETFEMYLHGKRYTPLLAEMNSKHE